MFYEGILLICVFIRLIVKFLFLSLGFSLFQTLCRGTHILFNLAFIITF